MSNAVKIAEAKTALHKIQMGAAEVEIRHGDFAAKYTPGDLDKLESYIARLEAEDAGARPRGAVGFVFGA